MTVGPDDQPLSDFTNEEIVEMADENGRVAVRPPDGITATCICGEQLEFVDIPVSKEPGNSALVHPCHCEVTYKQYLGILRKSTEDHLQGR